jgi:hippurate hydrolase
VSRLLFLLVLAFAVFARAHAADGSSLWPQLEPVYRDFHTHPELSLQEAETASKLAGKMKALGFDVTTGVGGHGVVAVLKNGPGKTVLLRTEMDALPVTEKTGLPFASTVIGKNAAGDTVGVMHACGHDGHMTAWLGAATLLSKDRASWRGTLVMIAQPAEEIAKGARAMLADGLLTRFPRPDAAIAVHDSEQLPAGTAGISPGGVMATSDSVDVLVHGKGGHGARPSNAIDPIVIASKIVVSLQTLVSRENDPFDPGVVTVGSFHAGTKHNIIPDFAKLQVTVRSFNPAVRDRLLAGLERIVKAECESGRSPKPPEINVPESIPVTSNDPGLTAQVKPALVAALGASRVVDQVRVMAAEDFSVFGQEAGIPALLIQIGATRPDALAKARKDGTTVPGLHSSEFAPDAQPMITTGIDVLVASAKSVFGSPK